MEKVRYREYIGGPDFPTLVTHCGSHCGRLNMWHFFKLQLNQHVPTSLPAFKLDIKNMLLLGGSQACQNLSDHLVISSFSSNLPASFYYQSFGPGFTPSEQNLQKKLSVGKHAQLWKVGRYSRVMSSRRRWSGIKVFISLAASWQYRLPLSSSGVLIGTDCSPAAKVLFQYY